MITPPLVRPCKDCTSLECGTYRCRFEEKVNNYANDMIKRDQETPQWLRELRTGDPR